MANICCSASYFPVFDVSFIILVFKVVLNLIPVVRLKGLLFLKHSLIYPTQNYPTTLFSGPQAGAKQLCMVRKEVVTGGWQRKDIALEEGKWW